MSREIPLTKGKVAIVDDTDFEWLSRWRWHTTGNDYAASRMGNNPIRYMHRVIADPPAGMHVDHIDGNGLNNQRANLRICTRSQNLYNQGKRRGACSSQYKGVSFEKQTGRWEVHIKTPLGEFKRLGRFTTELDAARAYDAAARIYHGEFARLNFPGPDERAA